MTEQQLRLISRLEKTQDGKDFLDEVLKPLLSENYFSLLIGDKSNRDELVGYGRALHYFVDLFETCDKRLLTADKSSPDWN